MRLASSTARNTVSWSGSVIDYAHYWWSFQCRMLKVRS